MCVSVFVCFVFVTQYLKSPAVKYKSLRVLPIANRKGDQQIYKRPFCSFLPNSLFFNKKKRSSQTEGAVLLDSPEETHRKDHGKELRKERQKKNYIYKQLFYFAKLWQTYFHASYVIYLFYFFHIEFSFTKLFTQQQSIWIKLDNFSFIWQWIQSPHISYFRSFFLTQTQPATTLSKYKKHKPLIQP